MWRNQWSGVLLGAAGLIVAAACHWEPDLPATSAQRESFVEGKADFVPATADDSTLVAEYGGTLRDMREPRLYGARTPAGMTVLRMLWVRSFDPPSAVRIVETPGHCTVVVAITGMPWQRYSPRGSDSVWSVDTPWPYNQPRQLLRRDSSEVAPARCAAIHAAAVAAHLWSGPVIGKEMGLDGDDVIMEIVDDGGHRIAKRWSPEPGSSPEFREIASRFIYIGQVDPRMGSLLGHWSPWADR